MRPPLDFEAVWLLPRVSITASEHHVGLLGVELGHCFPHLGRPRVRQRVSPLALLAAITASLQRSRQHRHRDTQSTVNPQLLPGVHGEFPATRVTRAGLESHACALVERKGEPVDRADLALGSRPVLADVLDDDRRHARAPPAGNHTSGRERRRGGALRRIGLWSDPRLGMRGVESACTLGCQNEAKTSWHPAAQGLNQERTA